MSRHLLEIYTLYVTIETFLCFSTYFTWVVYVISRLFLLCVTFFHLFYRRSFLSRQTGNFAGAHIVPRLKFTGATFKAPERREGQKWARLKYFTLVKWFMSFCEAFFSRNMQTKLLSCNTISYITSSRNVHNELWTFSFLTQGKMSGQVWITCLKTMEQLFDFRGRRIKWNAHKISIQKGWKTLTYDNFWINAAF